MQIFFTVISGVLIFVIGQAVQTFILKPIHDFKIVLGEISHKVKFHLNVITNSGLREEMVRLSSGDMRDLSCQLESRYLAIPFNDFFGNIKVIPKRNNIKEAAEDLIQLSNASGKRGYEEKNANAVNNLKKNLKIVL